MEEGSRAAPVPELLHKLGQYKGVHGDTWHPLGVLQWWKVDTDNLPPFQGEAGPPYETPVPCFPSSLGGPTQPRPPYTPDALSYNLLLASPAYSLL